MTSLRTALAVVLIAVLGLGYGASQWAFFRGTYADYAARVDTPPVRACALVALLLCVGFAFAPVRDDEEPS